MKDPEGFEREYAAATVVTAPTPKRKPKVAVDEADDDDDFTTVGKGGKAMNFTAEGIFKDLHTIQEARGRKVCTP